MSLDLSVVARVLYLEEGERNPGDEEKVRRLEQKIMDWSRDVAEPRAVKLETEAVPLKMQIANEIDELERKFEGYWCEGEKCMCERSHWVVHEKKSNCWECMHDPCACFPPLVFDEKEQAYYRFFLSCDGKTKHNIWMSEPTSDIAVIDFKRKEKKRKERVKKEEEEEQCHENQQIAKRDGYCCHEHARESKKKARVKQERQTLVAMDNGPDHCDHCDDDPCVFVQIESRLAENDEIYYDKSEYEKNSNTYNSSRRKRAFQYAAFILWEGINYRRQHYTCVENGVRALYPPFDGKIMGYKTR